MTMYRYFSSVDKLRKLPDLTASLSTKVPSSFIVLANAGVKSVVKSVVKSLFAKGKGLAMSSCRGMSMTVYNTGLSLTWLLFASDWIPDILINVVPRTILSTLNSFAGAITALSRVMWVWLAGTKYGRGFAIIKPRIFFREIFASGQSAKILSRENFSPYGSSASVGLGLC